MKALIIILFAMLLGGCATARLNPEAIDTPTKLSAVAPLPVSATPSVWTHADEFKAAGLPFRNETGRSFAKVFAGTKAEMPVLEIVRSSLSSDTQDLGFAIEFKYDVTVRLTRDGRAQEFEAHATYRATGFTGPATAAKTVTEDAIAQLADKIRPTLGL